MLSRRGTEPAMRVLTTSEGSLLSLPPDTSSSISRRLLEATKNFPSPVFRLKRGKLYAAQVVGTIQIPGVRVNILPKSSEESSAGARDFLLNILKVAGYFDLRDMRSANVSATIADPLEVLLLGTARDMLLALTEGVPRRYEDQREISSQIRGRVDFSQLSRRLPVDSGIPIRHAPLSPNNDLSRCLKGLTDLLLRLTQQQITKRLLAAVQDRLINVDNPPLSTAALDHLVLTAAESPWKRTIAIARLLLSGLSPNPTYSGMHEGFSLLFPLHHLFERVIRNVLSSARWEDNIELLQTKHPLSFLTNISDGIDVLSLRPDYILKLDGKIAAIADAKWKRVTGAARAYGVGRTDLFQMNAYLTALEVRDAIILVPRQRWMTESWKQSFAVSATDRRIHVIGVDIEQIVSRARNVREAAQSDLKSMISQAIRLQRTT